MIPHLFPLTTRATHPSCFPDCLLCGRDTWDCECDADGLKAHVS